MSHRKEGDYLKKEWSHRKEVRIKPRFGELENIDKKDPVVEEEKTLLGTDVAATIKQELLYLKVVLNILMYMLYMKQQYNHNFIMTNGTTIK